VITPQTGILAELGLDSLKLIELVDALKQKHGVDFLEAPHSIYSLRTVESIAAALSEVPPPAPPRLGL
jgi:acyl carrier protein